MCQLPSAMLDDQLGAYLAFRIQIGPGQGPYNLGSQPTGITSTGLKNSLVLVGRQVAAAM